MEEGETVSLMSRKELRKQKLMEYLAAKGRLKLPNPKPYLRDDGHPTRPVKSASKVVEGKENKAPAATLKHEGTKVQTLAAQSAKHAARMSFGVKGNVLTGQKNATCPSTARGSAQPGLIRNPAIKGTDAVVSSRPGLNSASHLKKQPIAGTQCLGRASSNVASNHRFRSSSNAAWSVPMKTASVGMSLGHIVKTKTGLTPAVIQPRHTMSHFSQASNTKATTITSVPKSECFGPSSSDFASQKSSTAQEKTARSAVSSATMTAIKVRHQNESNSRSLLVKRSQPPRWGQLSSGLKSAANSKCKVAPVKAEGRGGGMSNGNKSSGESTDRFTKQTAVAGGETNVKPRKGPTQTSSGPVGKGSFRATSGATRAAQQGGRTKTSQVTQSEKGHGSSNPPPPPPPAGMNKTGAPVTWQRVLHPARSVVHTDRTTDAKKPKVPAVRVAPQTEVKKLTAAQEERLKRLQEWREAKGIAYKRPPMPVKPQVRRAVAVAQPFWTSMKEEDDAHSLICAVDRSLADCIKLLGKGCPPDQVNDVLSRLPTVSQKFAKYWICRVRLMERQGSLDVLPVFEEAVRVVLEPVDELRSVVFEILKKRDEIQDDQTPTAVSSPESGADPLVTPKPMRVLIAGERGDSSVVKYKITSTPGGPRGQQREPARVNGQEVRFFTPVRRSVRIERVSLRLPVSLQDHDLCVASYDDLISEEDKESDGESGPPAHDTPMYVYRQNEALEDKVSVKLVCD
ncbi:cytoskeleton-associated protein 2-like isoform X1 [Scophthalmus maximus]|uniref:cytoskeleton-associated protein 2-like isoform X1 n=1 Tax=Scophthalmus maximus TaxID=52904 RepID=UPI001FA939B4|nr:cytoskeleton-associated protein 2-like isoform X1 [Scophthalmus maximus]